MFGDTPTDKILYCYGIYQPLFDQMKKDVPNLSFHHGLPDVEDIEALSGGHALLILDDLMQEVVNSKTMQDLFCQYYLSSHGYQCHVSNPESVPARKVCPHHCIKYPRASVDEEYEKRFSNCPLCQTAIPQ